MKLGHFRMNRTGVVSMAVAVVLGAASIDRASADAYVNQHLMVETGQIATMLRDPNVRVVDVRPKAAYDKGHIPNAVHLGADDVVDRDSHVGGDLLPFATLADMLGQRGIDRKTRVVLYDDRGGFHAARLFWMLEYFGHRKASVLNGGITRWTAEGRKLTTAQPSIDRKSFALTFTDRKRATADWLMDRRDDKSVVVIDVRPAKMYKAGHIPWARNIPWAANLDKDKSMKSANALLQHFAAHGVTKDKNVAVHCQNGKAAAHSYFTLRLLGFSRVRSYDRSWAEWGSADDLPKVVDKKG